MFARTLGLEVVRTPALYLTAKNYHLIDSVRRRRDALRAGGFWLKDADYLTVLACRR
jgi:predicted nucleic acid-binding protein